MDQCAFDTFIHSVRLALWEVKYVSQMQSMKAILSALAAKT